MIFCNKYSGSRGNLNFIDDGRHKILIDCGGQIGSVKNALKQHATDLKDIDAVLVTHEHNDHVSALECFLKYNDRAKVFVHESGANALYLKIPSAYGRLTTFDSPFDCFGYGIDFFECSHDAAFCVGYKVADAKGHAVASVTDTGAVNVKKICAFFKGCDTVLLESNHDEEMLRKGAYPATLKKRILSKKGHLSNGQAGEILKVLPDANVKNVFLGHISLDNNTEEMAFNQAVFNIERSGAKEGKDLNVFVARQFTGGEKINV